VSSARGVVAAGHPVTARAGADVLRAGGNAVDASIAAVLASWVAEPLLSGPGAGGYLLVAGAGEAPTLLDFFVEAPGRGADVARRADLVPVDVSFGDAIQRFNAGPAAAGTYGTPAGLAAAAERFGTLPLADLAAPAAALARAGVPQAPAQAYVLEILGGILTLTPESSALFAPAGRLLRAGEPFVSPELADTIELLGREGAAPFYTGAVADAVVDWLEPRGGMVTREDLRAYAAVAREPLAVPYRGRSVLTNPPPNAGGVLLAVALHALDATPAPPPLAAVVAAMDSAQAERTSQFTNGLADPSFARRFVSSRRGSTTHITVIDADGRAASVTCTNGEGCGVVVPGPAIHLNNIMGEEDLSPLGFHRAAPGTRMPSMMAPTVVVAGGAVEVALGSAGSNRIRSAILQTLVGVVDHGLTAADAVTAPRCHREEGVLYTEPGVPVEELGGDLELVRFREPNLFFGGVNAVVRDPRTGTLSGAGDPRRGGAAVTA